jgi:hypothetical protein
MKTGRQASLATLLLSLWLCLYLKPCCGEITSEYAALHGVATDAVHAAHTEMHILAAEVELFVGVSQHTVQRRRDLVVAEAVWKAASVAHSKASVCMSLHKKASVSDDAALTPAQLKSKQQALSCGRYSHSHTTLYISLVICHVKYTWWREFEFNVYASRRCSAGNRSTATRCSRASSQHRPHRSHRPSERRPLPQRSPSTSL